MPTRELIFMHVYLCVLLQWQQMEETLKYAQAVAHQTRTCKQEKSRLFFFLDIYMLVFYLFGNNQLAGKSLALLNKNMSLF